MSSLFEKIGGRKFVFMLILLGMGLAIDLYTTRGLSETFKELMVFLAAIYITGNGVAKVTATIGDNAKVKAKSEKVNKDVEKNIQAMLQYQDAILSNVQLSNQGLSELIKNKSSAEVIK